MTVDRRGLPNGANTGLNLMKKTFISLILILLAYFFAINPSYCEEDFFLDGNFSESKNKLKIPNSKVKKAIENSKQSGLFSKFKKNTKSNIFSIYNFLAYSFTLEFICYTELFL